MQGNKPNGHHCRFPLENARQKGNNETVKIKPKSKCQRLVCQHKQLKVPTDYSMLTLQKNCSIVTEKFRNCDGKVQFVTEIVTESTPSQFHSSQIDL